MAFCRKCGAQMDDEIMCPSCGAEAEHKLDHVKSDAGSFGFGLLGFCIPVVGLVLFIVWKQDRPGAARSAGIGALISTIISVIVYAIYVSTIASMM